VIRSLKPKVCKNQGCRQRFMPTQPLQSVCSPRCALDAVRGKARVEQRTADKARLRELMSRGDHMKLAQAAFNRYIRARDAADPCISCSADLVGSKRYANAQWHAGHYQAVGSHPELRFDEDNVHKQCNRCNFDLSGNKIDYRIGLIRKIGLVRVERLETKHPPAKLSVKDLEEITVRYNRMARELTRPQQARAA
jgi:hypothetical protein